MSTAPAQSRTPDILNSLAQLSSGEVPTPPALANSMLDLLPAEVWSDPNLKWVDPCSKSGVFLREITTRLFVGLSEWEPRFKKRREHIFRNMLYGDAITETTGQVSRRTLYYSRHAAGDLSVVRFDNDAGNLPFVQAEHRFSAGGNAGSCAICGAPAAPGINPHAHAYSFIHQAYPTKEMKDMKFDVVVGNPPYQVDSAGNTRTIPLYHLFVKRAIELDPRYVLMITPSRWFAGGLGMTEFRAEMLADRRIKRLVDYRIEKDAFPGVNINGGVSYFLWDRLHDGPCLVTHVAPGGAIGEPQERFLNEFDLLIRQNEAVGILRKVRSKQEPTLDEKVSSQKPFEMHTNFHGASSPDKFKDPVLLYGARRKSWVSRSEIVKNASWIDQWKVLVPKASDGNEIFPAPIWDVAVGPFVAGPREICSGSYLVIGPSNKKVVATRTAAYLRTRFVRFLVSLRKITQDNTANRFAFVPDLPMDQKWTDEMLYKRYRLTRGEVAYIESQIKEMTAPKSAR